MQIYRLLLLALFMYKTITSIIIASAKIGIYTTDTPTINPIFPPLFTNTVVTVLITVLVIAVFTSFVTVE